MKATLLASGLGFPEGPVVMSDGRVVLCDGNTGELLVYTNGNVSTCARTGGSPWGTVPGNDGAIYVTQGGNVPGSGDTSAVSGIQRVLPDGTVELLFSEVAGYQLHGTSDLRSGRTAGCGPPSQMVRCRKRSPWASTPPTAPSTARIFTWRRRARPASKPRSGPGRSGGSKPTPPALT